MPNIGASDSGMPLAPEGAPRDIEQEISAYRTLPREDGRHTRRVIFRNQHILMQ
jgi:hypothetical protein